MDTKIKNRLSLRNGGGTWLAWLLFAAASLLITAILAKTRVIYFYSDWGFHANRVEELYQNLKTGHWFTFISARYFTNSGAGSFLFYPIIFFYPWALLRFILSPVAAFYGWYALLTFVTLVTSYWSMRAFTCKTNGWSWRSFAFAMLYTFNAYRLYLGTAVFGEFIAVSFLPIVFLGAYEIFWGDYSNWWHLALGGTLLFYSHLLSVVITSEFLVVLVVIKLITSRKFELVRLRALLCSGLVACGLSLGRLIPYLTDYVGQHIFSAYPGIGISTTISQIVTTSLTNGLFYGVGFVLMAGLLLGWVLISNGKELTLFILAWLALVLATTLFPWSKVGQTSFGMVQLTFRYLAYTALFASALLALFVGRLKLKEGSWLFESHVVGQIIAAVAITGLFVIIGALNLSPVRNTTAPYLAKPTTDDAVLFDTVRVDSRNYNQIFSYLIKYGEYDYYPIVARGTIAPDGISPTSQSIVHHLVEINGKNKVVKPTASANALTFKLNLKKPATVNLPVVAYRHTVVMVNGKTRSFKLSKRATPQLKLKAGSQRVTVTYRPSAWYWIGLVVSICSWGALVVWRIKTRFGSNQF